MGKFNSLFARVDEAKKRAPKLGPKDSIKVSKLPSHLQAFAKDLLKFSAGMIFYSKKSGEVFDISIEYPDEKPERIVKHTDYKQVVK